jgi:hypothetical protein
MKIVKVQRIGNTIHHGIAYTEHDGYGGTSDQAYRFNLKMAVAYEIRHCIKDGEQYQLSVNGKNKGTFIK